MGYVTFFGAIYFVLFICVSSQCGVGFARAFIGSAAATLSALFFTAVFLHWTANTSASDERTLPTLVGTILGAIAFVIFGV